ADVAGDAHVAALERLAFAARRLRRVDERGAADDRVGRAGAADEKRDEQDERRWAESVHACERSKTSATVLAWRRALSEESKARPTRAAHQERRKAGDQESVKGRLPAFLSSWVPHTCTPVVSAMEPGASLLQVARSWSLIVI